MGTGEPVHPGEILTAEKMNLKLDCFEVEDIVDGAILPRHISREFIQQGSGTTATTGEAEIAFPVAFPKIPLVFVTVRDPERRACVVDVYERKTSSFRIRALKIQGETTTTVLAHTHTVTIPAYGYTIRSAKICPAGHAECVAEVSTVDAASTTPQNSTTTTEHAHEILAVGASIHFDWIAFCL